MKINNFEDIIAWQYVAIKLGYLNSKQFKIIHSMTLEISKLLSGFIKTL